MSASQRFPAINIIARIESRLMHASKKSRPRASINSTMNCKKLLHAANELTTPYNATEDGFVLANDEMEPYIGREDRRTAPAQQK